MLVLAAETSLPGAIQAGTQYSFSLQAGVLLRDVGGSPGTTTHSAPTARCRIRKITYRMTSTCGLLTLCDRMELLESGALACIARPFSMDCACLPLAALRTRLVLKASSCILTSFWDGNQPACELGVEAFTIFMSRAT